MGYHIRVCVRGLIIHNDRIALNEFNNGEFYNQPGGGVEPGETIREADVDPVNPDTKCNGAKWIQIEGLDKVNYVPYIHKQLMEYLASGIFTPRFFEEPLVKEK